MGIHKQLPLEKERPPCHLTPIVMLGSPSTFPTFSSLSLSYLLAMYPCLTCFVPKSAPPYPRARLRSDLLTHILTPVAPVPSPSFDQGKLIFFLSSSFSLIPVFPEKFFNSNSLQPYRVQIISTFIPPSSAHQPGLSCHPTPETMQTSANCACNSISVFVWPHFSQRKQKCDLTLQQIYHYKLPLMSPKQW